MGDPERQLNICFMTRGTVAHGGGGMEQHSEALRRGLAARGHRVTVITTPHPHGTRCLTDEWGETYFVGEGTPGAYSADWWKASTRELERLSASGRFDVVAGHGKAAYAYLAARRHWPTSQRMPVVVVTHNNIVTDFLAMLRAARRRPQRLLRWLPRGAALYADDLLRLRLAEAITALSEVTAAPLRRWFGVDARRVVVIPNGVEVALCQAAASARGATRQRLGIPDETCVVLSVARLTRDKGQEHLIQALARPDLRAIQRPILAVVAGSGPRAEALAALAQRLGVGESVRFLGAVPHERVPALFHAADIVAYPSLVDGMPLTVLEAMACGRPIVASRIGPIASLLDEGETGLLVPPARPAALARALAELIQWPDRARALGQRAQARAEAHYDQQLMIARYERVFQAVAASRATEARPATSMLRRDSGSPLPCVSPLLQEKG